MSSAGEMRRDLFRFGWGISILYLLNRVLLRISRGNMQLITYRLAVQPVAPTALVPAGHDHAIRTRLMTENELSRVPHPRPAEVVAARFRQGAVCIAAFRGDEFMGFAWFLVGDYLEDEVRCRFRPLPAGRTAWDFDVYVDPGHRLGKTFVRLWDAINHELRSRGVTRTCSRISAYNTPSLNAHRRLGAEFRGVACFLVIGRLQLLISRRLRFPWMHLSWSAVPEVEVIADA